METMKRPPFQTGDRVFWTDPHVHASGMGTIIEIQGEDEDGFDPHDLADLVLTVAKDDGGEAEVLASELCREDMLLTYACSEALSAFRSLYSELENGTEPETLLELKEYWPLTLLRGALTTAGLDEDEIADL